MEYLRRKTDAGDRRGVVERLAHANEHGVSLALAPHEVAMVMSLLHDGRTLACQLVERDWRDNVPPRGDALVTK